MDTWTNMVYWRGVKAALAVGRDSSKPIGPLWRGQQARGLGRVRGYQPLGSAGDPGWAIQTPGSWREQGHPMNDSVGNSMGKVAQNTQGTWYVFLHGDGPRGMQAGTVLLNVSHHTQWPRSRYCIGVAGCSTWGSVVRSCRRIS